MVKRVASYAGDEHAHTQARTHKSRPSFTASLSAAVSVAAVESKSSRLDSSSETPQYEIKNVAAQ
jgi:hypothetical protein